MNAVRARFDKSAVTLGAIGEEDGLADRNRPQERVAVPQQNERPTIVDAAEVCERYRGETVSAGEGMRYRKLLIAWGVAAMALVAGCGGPPSSATIARLKSDAKPILLQLEAYRSSHGEYPGDVSKAGIMLPDSAYDGWHYRTKDGTSFILNIGDYGKHDFVLYWDSKNGDWYLDT